MGWTPPAQAALVHRGVVHYYEQDRFSAVDAENGETLWSATVDPEHPKVVQKVHALGDGLLVGTVDERTGEKSLYLVSPDSSGTWERIGADEGDLRADFAWHKSSYSKGGHQECVEVAEGPTTALRDTRNRHLAHLEFPATEWKAFLAAVKG